MRILSSIRDGVYGPQRRDAPSSDAVASAEEAEPRVQAPHVIDIENHLDSMPGADHLNWRTSIVDLMTLIGVDSSLEAREALASELGYPGNADGSIDMDNWLHERVMADLTGHSEAAQTDVGD